MRSSPVTSGLVAGALLLSVAVAFAQHEHCAQVLRVVPIVGNPGWVGMQTMNRTIVAKEPRPAAPTSAKAIDYTVKALSFKYDSDNNVNTVVDTLRILVGSTVRFQWVAGFHTLTEGLDSGDIGPNTHFDYALDPSHTTFDTTFTVPGTTNYFCQVHEGATRNTSMAGTIIVQSSSSVPNGGLTSRATFSRPPAPNPARAGVSFAIALPVETPVELTVHDVSGRVVAELARGAYGAGEHAFRWDGRTNSGTRAAAGRYIVRLRAGSVTESRAFSLLR